MGHPTADRRAMLHILAVCCLLSGAALSARLPFSARKGVPAAADGSDVLDIPAATEEGGMVRACVSRCDVTRLAMHASATTPRQEHACVTCMPLLFKEVGSVVVFYFIKRASSIWMIHAISVAAANFMHPCSQ
eukprot:9502225-Pyramimonas_sp.AAC.1